MDGSAAPVLVRKGFPLPVTARRGASSAGTVPGFRIVPGVGTGVLLDALKVLKPAVTSAGLVDQLRGLEDLKSAIAGVQARIAVAFDVSERQIQADAGVPATEQGNSVGAQVALARRESPSRGSRLLGLARALVTEMP
ncbi:HNH endonuclease, partial [Arthrobacter sp. Hz1]